MTAFKNVKEWFTKIYLEQKIFKSTSMDLDYFLVKNDDPLCFTKKGIEMLNELIELCGEEGILEDIMPSIVIPLKDAENSDLVTFNKKKFILENELHDFSPGDICLVKRDIAQYYKTLEEYKCSIDIEWPGIINRNCRSYYRCFRGEEGVKNNWEFCRYIRIEHYTDNLLKFGQG